MFPWSIESIDASMAVLQGVPLKSCQTVPQKGSEFPTIYSSATSNQHNQQALYCFLKLQEQYGVIPLKCNIHASLLKHVTEIHC